SPFRPSGRVTSRRSCTLLSRSGSLRSWRPGCWTIRRSPHGWGSDPTPTSCRMIRRSPGYDGVSATTSITIVSAGLGLLDGEGGRCVTAPRVASLRDLRGVLDALASQRREPRETTLDLVAHSTRGHHFVRLGSDPIDMFDPAVVSFFEA